MRNRFFWLLATIMMCGAVMTGLTSCSNIDNNDGNNNDQKRAALLLPDASRIDRWAIDLANLEDAMATYGIKTTSYVAPETAEGAMQQVEQLRTAINDGVEYIVLTTIDYQKINESGLLQQHPDVKVVCHDRFIFDNPYIAYFSSTDTKEVGRTQASFLLDHFNASGKASMTLEILQGPETDCNAKDYYDGAMELLQKYIDSGKLVVKSGKTVFHSFLFVFNIPTGSLHVVVFRLAALYYKLSVLNVFPKQFHSSVIIIPGIAIGLRALKDFEGHGSFS